jgi:hypothetical protein
LSGFLVTARAFCGIRIFATSAPGRSACFCQRSVASWPSNVMVVALQQGLMDSKDLVSRDRLQTL